MSLHLGALSNLRNWNDSIAVVINRYALGFEDSLSLNDAIIVLRKQAPLIGKTFNDSLNNWTDSVSINLVQAPAAAKLISDTLDNWADSFTVQVQGGLALSFSVGDSLNNWNDNVSSTVNITHFNIAIGSSLDNWDDFVDTYTSLYFVETINNWLDAVITYSDIFLRITDNINNWNDIAARSPTTLEQSQLGIVDVIIFDDFVEILLQEVPPLIRFAHICWSDEYLKRTENDAIDEIMREVEHKWERFSLDITNGVGLYNLPDYVISITAVTWKGKPLLPLTPSELEDKDPLYRTTTGEPKYYTRYGDGPYKIRLSPIPNEILVAATTEGMLGSEINTSFIVSCYRKRSSASNAINIPDYIGRRTLKPYILEKAFRKEGKCQNLKASQYYKAKYEMIISLFKSIQNNYYIGREPISNNLTANRRPQYARLADDFTIHT